jgi:hypothetical protein
VIFPVISRSSDHRLLTDRVLLVVMMLPVWLLQGIKIAPALISIAVGLIVRYVIPIPAGVSVQVGGRIRLGPCKLLR